MRVTISRALLTVAATGSSLRPPIQGLLLSPALRFPPGRPLLASPLPALAPAFLLPLPAAVLPSLPAPIHPVFKVLSTDPESAYLPSRLIAIELTR